VSDVIKEDVVYSEIIHAPVSDHDAVVVCFNTDHEKRGTGYWKLNASVLHEEKYQSDIRDIISDTIREYTGSENTLIWELIKIRVREYSIRYCTIRNRSKCQLLKGLEFSINKIKQYMHRGDAPEEFQHQKDSLEKEIGSLLSKKLRELRYVPRHNGLRKVREALPFFCDKKDTIKSPVL